LHVSFICWFRVLFFVFFIAEKLDGVGDKVSGDTTMVVPTLLGAFLNTSLRSGCFIDETFPGDK
jgi:hypothetical protein